ncbi:hypothetical protein ACVW1A_004861 [Bradyrhizobium sp. LB1.3]|uniref:hypothetical protein n=1 Tax=Bradyrhizobium sp. 197 TaxID=2782663 RepID=UPI001FFA1704|nr:hypothetical protein [Bradyrhizobium sp. 197]MCK1479422.1 hypothetical protein [Bradyrhizobium sp. 197]
MSGYAARTMKSRVARGSKPNSRADSIVAQHLVEQEDEALKRKLYDLPRLQAGSRQ